MSRAPLLKRRLNPFLIAATVTILALLAALSVFYQGSLNDMLSENQNLHEQLNDTKAEVERLSLENQNLSNRLDETNEELQETRVLLNSTQEQKNQLESRVQELENEKKDLDAEVSDLKESQEELEGYLQDICNQANSNTTDVTDNTCERYQQ